MWNRTVLGVLIICATSLSGCSFFQRGASNSVDPQSTVAQSETPAPAQSTNSEQVLTGTDGETEITLPKGWQEDRDLHDEAQIQASDRSRELYVIVLSESKQDFPEPITLSKHSEITRDILIENLTDPQVSGPTNVTSIDGNSAVQYKIQGTISGIAVTYLHTTVETPDYYNQILAWTLPEKFDNYQAELQQVVASFHEIRPASASQPSSPTPSL